jgi:hypothetical protein
MSAYLTTRKLANIIDLPVALSATELKQGDWLAAASVKIASPMKLTCRLLSASILAATVDISSIGNSNKIVGSLGLVYVILRRDYAGGSPAEAGALDTLVLNDIGTASRNVDQVLTLTVPGVYSWIVANNMQPSSSSLVPASTEINFRVAITGSARLSLDANA